MELLSFHTIQSVQVMESLPPHNTLGFHSKSLEHLHTSVDGLSYVMILLGAKLRLALRFNSFG